MIGKEAKSVSSADAYSYVAGYTIMNTRVTNGPAITAIGASALTYAPKQAFTMWTTYQPASRFWPFQWIEGGGSITTTV